MTRTTSVASARIIILGQSSLGACDGLGVVKVSRSMPAIMNGHMSQREWTSFCDRLDEALKPMNTLKTTNLCLLVGGFLLAAVLVILGLRSSERGIIFGIIATVLVVLGIIFAAILTNIKTSETRDSLTCVCQKQSKRKPLIRFRVLFDVSILGNNRNILNSGGSDAHNYIKVSVANPEAGMPAVSPLATSKPTESGNKIIVKRLVELDAVKIHLTEEEYEEKRAEILSTL